MITVIFYRSKLSARKERYRFRIESQNGEPLARGEGYARREDARAVVCLILNGHSRSLTLPAHVDVVYDRSWK